MIVLKFQIRGVINNADTAVLRVINRGNLVIVTETYEQEMLIRRDPPFSPRFKTSQTSYTITIGQNIMIFGMHIRKTVLGRPISLICDCRGIYPLKTVISKFSSNVNEIWWLGAV